MDGNQGGKRSAVISDCSGYLPLSTSLSFSLSHLGTEVFEIGPRSRGGKDWSVCKKVEPGPFEALRRITSPKQMPVEAAIAAVINNVENLLILGIITFSLGDRSSSKNSIVK